MGKQGGERQSKDMAPFTWPQSIKSTLKFNLPKNLFSGGGRDARSGGLPSLNDFGTRFTTSEEVVRVMEKALRSALSVTGATAGYIMLAEADEAFTLLSRPGEGASLGSRRRLVTERVISLGEERAVPPTLVWGEGMEGSVAETGRPILWRKQKGPKGQETSAGELRPAVSGAIEALCAPLLDTGEETLQTGILGVFVLLSDQPGRAFTPDAPALTQIYADVVAMALVNSRQYLTLQKSFLHAMKEIAKSLGSHDPARRGHVDRVAAICEMLAGRLHVTPETTEDLRMGALMHEIGKIGIPETILYKPERLTDEEFALLRWYPVIGYEMCKPLGLREGVLMLIRNHAERLDGTGYPDGLRQGQLPLPVRIMSVADAYDAMSSTRTYRQAMTQRERTEQLNRFAGTQFDPIVVETLKELVNEGELEELYRDRGDLVVEADTQDDSDSPFLRAA